MSPSRSKKKPADHRTASRKKSRRKPGRTPTGDRATLGSGNSSKPKTGLAPGYLHGFTAEEQDRLYRQARFLEPYVYSQIHFPPGTKLLEVGSGVGAQTEILLRRNPGITVTSVDASKKQLARARNFLERYIKQKRVQLIHADALHLPLEDNSFDAAFLCWFLEHVSEPVEVLKEIRRKQRENTIIHCTEVLNSSFFVHPYSPATLQYCFEFNDHQWNMKGDPFIGAKLGNYLQKAGYQNIQTQIVTHHYDNRSPKMRAMFIEDRAQLLLSSAPELIKAGKVTTELVRQMRHELDKLKDDPDAVFIDSWVHATAQAL